MSNRIINIDNIETYPFAWTSNPKEAKHTFKECYEQVLVPQRKYTINWQDRVEKFYRGGAYDFLGSLEDHFGNCSSLCNIELFHLSIDVDRGHPESECLKQIRIHFNKEADQIFYLLCLMGAVVVLIPLFAFS
jgi:hypothetical protein